MEKKVRVGILIVTLCFLVLPAYALAQSQDASVLITKDSLKAMLGSGNMTLIDLRFGKDWTDATVKIKGATREDPMKPGQWMDKYPKDSLIVFY